MNAITFNILYLIVNLFGAYTLSKVFQLFFKKPIRRKHIVYGSYALFFIVNSSCFLLLENPAITAIVNLALYIGISQSYRAPFWKKILYIFLIYIAFIVLEGLTMIAFNLIGLSQLAAQSNLFMVWGTLVVNIIAFVISSIILRKDLLIGYENISLKTTLPIFVLSILILILAIFLPPLNYNNDLYVTISILTLCAISVFMYIFIDNIEKISEEKSKKEIFENQIEYYKIQISLMNRQQNNIKTIRHNIKGQIETIYTLIDDDKIEPAKEFIDGLIDLVKINEKKVSTNIPEFDSLMNYKINLADKMGISISVNTRLEEDIRIKSHDYISVLDNLINNAIDAVKDLESDKKEVLLVFGAFKGTVFIKIENAYEHEINVTNDIFKTTKNDPEKHGYGIEYIKSIVNKYNGKINIDYSTNFSVKMFMHNSYKEN